jgi:hypothetical protein
MVNRRAARTLLAVLSMTMLVACSAPTDPATTRESTSTEDGHTEIDVHVTIKDGWVTPVDEMMSATVGEPITLLVDSDTGDELHIHAVPERTFEVKPGTGQRFEFTVDVPGRVEVELHRLHRTIALIDVRP